MVELVRAGYEAFNRGGVSAILEMLDPEIEWQTDSGTPEADIHRGTEDVRNYLEGFVGVFETLRLDPTECISKGNQVLAGLEARGQIKGSGIELEQRWWHLWTVREAKGIHVFVFFDRARALDAMKAPATGSES
jgi:ketosteroid isomerase-like protein